MRHEVLSLIFGTLAVLVLPGVSLGADEKEKRAAEKPDPAALEKMMEEWGKPGPEHECFKHLAGTWKATVKTYMEDPEKPTVSEGESTFKTLMGGRFVQQNFRCKMGDKSFRGMGLSGYDKTKKKYVGVWIDDMSTSMMHTEGTFDKESNTMTETGTSACPMGEMKMKMVTKVVDDDHFTFTMYTLQDAGKETKMMEIAYERQEKEKK